MSFEVGANLFVDNIFILCKIEKIFFEEWWWIHRFIDCSFLHMYKNTFNNTVFEINVLEPWLS